MEPPQLKEVWLLRLAGSAHYLRIFDNSYPWRVRALSQFGTVLYLTLPTTPLTSLPQLYVSFHLPVHSWSISHLQAMLWFSWVYCSHLIQMIEQQMKNFMGIWTLILGFMWGVTLVTDWKKEEGCRCSYSIVSPPHFLSFSCEHWSSLDKWITAFQIKLILI